MPKKRKIRKVVRDAYYIFMTENMDPNVSKPTKMDKIIADRLLSQYKLKKKSGDSPPKKEKSK